ncbi:choice-of-anchor D domain-containing protein [Barnesiella viscericola]|uniref:choice-of-anchor D domain-containing protein n=1 Tax=Barnesiella viscericola TaxID=397865 RepID=UPI0023525EBA|nr:choice-of-anchor D domain-containing protein [Barnesiella viscericola]
MIPESYVSLTEDLVGQTGWETKTGFQNLDPGTYKLAFLWYNNGNLSGSDKGAMIDNVKIEKLANEPNVSVATSLEFPLTEVGASATATLTVTNTGGGDLNISGISFSNPDFELADAVEFPDVIASVGGEKSYKIKFTPSSEGEITGTMTIQSNAPETVVFLSGTGFTHIEITDEAPLFEDFNNLDESQPNMGLTPWTLKAGYATGSWATQWLVGTDSFYACDGTALKAETYPTTSYYESFDASTSLPTEWVVARSSGQTNYSIAGEAGIDGTKALYAMQNMYSELDTLYSPVVSGKVTFDFRKQYLSSKMEAYVVAADGSKTAIDVETNATDWIPVVVDNVPEGSRIAFLMQNTYLDNFLAFGIQHINKGVQIVNSSLKPGNGASLYAGDDRAEDNELQFTIKNIGIQPVEAGSYNFTTRLVDENGALPEGVSYKIYLDSDEGATLCEDNVIPGPALDVNEEKTLSGYLHIDSEALLENLTFHVTANDVENTHFAQMQTGNNLTLLPNKGETSLGSVEFGIVNKSTTIDYTIENSSENGALTVSGITAPEGSAFTVNAEFPLVIPNGESSTIQITFAAEPGVHTATLTVNHDGIGDTEISVSGTMLSPTALLESFESLTVPPLLWKTMQNKWSRSTISPYDGQACIAVTSATPDTIATPLLHLAAGDSIAFAVKSSSSSSYKTEVLYSADGQKWTSLETISTYNSSSWSSWAQKAVYMPEGFVEGDYYLAFACQRTYLDRVYGPQVVYQDHNIYIDGFEGETTGMVNYTQDFTIDLICLSSEGETSDSYTIDLMNDDEKIGTFDVEGMTLNESKSYTCSWTPHAAGEAHVYALISSNGTVSSTDTITVDVAEESFITNLLIGDLSTPTSTSSNRHTVFETLYTPELLEGLNDGDVIGSIRLPYITNSTYYTLVKGFKVNVWIGNTEKSELTTDKLSAADIEGLTHIGVDMSFEAGGTQESPLYFEMTPETPITYDGGNLSLIVSVDSIGYGWRDAAQFFLSEGAANSMKYCAFDAQVAGYEAAWAESYTPQLRADIMTVELDLIADAPVVYGIVTQADSQEPIEGATVTMQSGSVIYTATTDASGAYSIEVLQPGKEYTMSVTKDQYTAVEGVTLLVESGDNIEQNFALSIASGIDHTIEAATKIFTDRSGNIHVEAGSPINLVKVYSMSGSLCISESPATESAIVNAGGLKGVYVVEVQTSGSVKRAKIRL